MKNLDIASVSATLKALRIEKGLSQQDLASAVKMTLRGYQKYEYQEREPKASAIMLLAQVLDVSTDYILGLDDIPNRKTSGNQAPGCPKD